LRGIAFVGGEGPSHEALRKIAQGARFFVAADSGLLRCEGAGLTPDWIVGDMDSVAEAGRLEKYPSEKILRFPADKDFTDTEFALNLLKEKGCGEIWIAGGGGGRLDHLFAIRSLFERENPPDRWFPGREEVCCLNEGFALRADLAPGSIVSLFPLGAGPWAAESSGLKWPLDAPAWERGSAWISNAAVGEFIEIRAARGRFMIVMPMLLETTGVSANIKKVR